jgi:hypothetical protein
MKITNTHFFILVLILFFKLQYAQAEQGDSPVIEAVPAPAINQTEPAGKVKSDLLGNQQSELGLIKAEKSCYHKEGKLICPPKKSRQSK